MLVKVFGAAVQGIEATTITIEVNTDRGIKFFLVGMPDEAVKESHERIISALRYNNLKFPSCQIIINMAPADVRKEGASYDLPLAIGILAASQSIKADNLSRYMIMGELSLDGSLQPIKGVLSIAMLALRSGFEGLILPKANAQEAAVIEGLTVYGVENISQVIDFFNGEATLEPTEHQPQMFQCSENEVFEYDFQDVKGQESVKRAFEVAAAGSHNLILIGPPGSGKSMMAKRLPSILPPLSLEESLESSQVHSVAGLMARNAGLLTKRPFRSPHHTISQVALVGGGQHPKPGEISLAHHGVLFADELPEWNKRTLEVLRQPLEDHKICISRTKYSVEYPCSFMFVAAMNPCPCGMYNDPTRECTCTPTQVQNYLNRISGPLMDRIDLQIEISPVPYKDMSNNTLAESSSKIRERVIYARHIQEKRFANEPGIFCNAQMTPRLLRKYAQPSPEGQKLLRNAMERMGLSARAYDRILKVARTIADLDGSEHVEKNHIAEAISYRALDRGNWSTR